MIVVSSSYNIYILITKEDCKEILQERLSLQGGGKDYGRNILFKKKKNYLWLCWVFVAVLGLSPVVENGAGRGWVYCLAVGQGFLIVVNSFIAEHGV